MTRRDPTSPSYELDTHTLRMIDERRETFWFAELYGTGTRPRLVWPVVFNDPGALDRALQLLGPVVYNGETVKLERSTCKAGSALARACRAHPVRLHELEGVALVDLLAFTAPYADRSSPKKESGV